MFANLKAIHLSRRAFCLILCGLSLFSFGLHLHQLVSSQRLQQETNATPVWRRGMDAAGYFEMCMDVREGRPMTTVFRDRTMLPILFNTAYSIYKDPVSFSYAVQIFHGFMPWVLAGLAVLLFKNRWVGIWAAGLYILYAPAYGISMVLGTDFIHACFLSMALLATLLFLRTYHWRHIICLVGLWWCTMHCRPTFLLIGVLLAPILLLYWYFEKLPLRKVLACLIPLCLIPLCHAIDNQRTFGVFTYSLNGMENIHTILIPSINATKRQAAGEQQDYSKLRLEERETQAKQYPAYQALNMWTNTPPATLQERAGFKANMQQVKDFDRQIIRENLGTTTHVVWRGMEWMLFTNVRSLFGPLAGPLQGQFYKLLIFFGAIGLWILIFVWHQYGPGFLLGGVMGVLCLTASPFYWTPDRFMLPVHFILFALLPVVLSRWHYLTLAVGSLMLWKGLNMLISDNSLLTFLIVLSVLTILLPVYARSRLHRRSR